MPAATMTTKGQVTVPKEVRDRLGLDAGSVLSFIPKDEGYFVVAKTGSARDLCGILPKPVRPISLEEMEAGIAAGAAEAMNS